jgi:hypothetical protein
MLKLCDEKGRLPTAPYAAIAQPGFGTPVEGGFE